MSVSFSKCMQKGCDAAPEWECVWADGRARAWFCDKHYEPWKKEADKGEDGEGSWLELVKERRVKGGVVGKKYGEEPASKKAAAKKYDHIDFKPPESVAKAAEKGLEYRQKASPSNKGGLTSEEAGKAGIGSGVQRAVNLKNRDEMSPETVKMMHGFFSRHEKNKSIAAEHKDEPWNDKGYVAWLLWGGDPGQSWAAKVVKQMEAADERAKTAGSACNPLALSTAWITPEGKVIPIPPNETHSSWAGAYLNGDEGYESQGFGPSRYLTDTLGWVRLVNAYNIEVGPRGAAGRALRKAAEILTECALSRRDVDPEDTITYAVGSRTRRPTVAEFIATEGGRDLEERLFQGLMARSASETYGLKGGNEPTDQALWGKITALAKTKFKWPSATGSAWAVQRYNEQGGGWEKKAALADKETGNNTPTLKEAWGPLLTADADGSYMTVQNLRGLEEHSSELLGKIDEGTPLDDWVESLVSQAATKIESVYEFMEHGKGRVAEGPKVDPKAIFDALKEVSEDPEKYGVKKDDLEKLQELRDALAALTGEKPSKGEKKASSLGAALGMAVAGVGLLVAGVAASRKLAEKAGVNQETVSKFLRTTAGAGYTAAAVGAASVLGAIAPDHPIAKYAKDYDRLVEESAEDIPVLKKMAGKADHVVRTMGDADMDKSLGMITDALQKVGLVKPPPTIPPKVIEKSLAMHHTLQDLHDVIQGRAIGTSKSESNQPSKTTYQDYAARKKQEGGRVMPKDEWEARYKSAFWLSNEWGPTLWGEPVVVSQIAKEEIPGGLARGKKPSDFDADELKMGIEVEKEHLVGDSYSPKEMHDKAQEIAMDHLTEIPDYYTRLKKMESEAEGKKAARGQGRNKAEWMKQYELLTGVGGTKLQDFWDTATYLFNRGLTPEDAADQSKKKASSPLVAAWGDTIEEATRVQIPKVARSYKRLVMFDFDGTLFRSWEATPTWWVGTPMDTGPYSFFVNPESLDEPCVPDNPSSNFWIPSAVAGAKEAMRDAGTVTVLITGRVGVHKKRVQELLRQKGLDFDHYYFNPGMSAARFKVVVLKNLLVGYNTIDKVEIWENENQKTYDSAMRTTAKAVERDVEVEVHHIHVPPKELECGPEDFGLSPELPSPEMRLARRNAKTAAVTGDGTSVGLFIPLPEHLAEQFPSLEPHDDSPAHITFMYVGPVAPDRQEEFLEVLQKGMAYVEGPITAALDGIDIFQHQDKRVAYSRVRFSRSLSEIHDQLKNYLSTAGFPVAHSFPFLTPHVTISYMGPHDKWEGVAPEGSWSFSDMQVWGLPKLKTVSLGVEALSLPEPPELGARKFARLDAKRASAALLRAQWSGAKTAGYEKPPQNETFEVVLKKPNFQGEWGRWKGWTLGEVNRLRNTLQAAGKGWEDTDLDYSRVYADALRRYDLPYKIFDEGFILFIRSPSGESWEDDKGQWWRLDPRQFSRVW